MVAENIGSAPSADWMVDWDALDLFALGRTLIARIGKHIHLFTLSERAGLRHVFDVGRRTDHGVNQARIGIDADVALHPEVPLVAFNLNHPPRLPRTIGFHLVTLTIGP